MLSEERFSKILNILSVKKAVTVTELVEILNTSESTIRRDLTSLDKMGKLNKVFGGATSKDFENELIIEEKDVKTKYDLNKNDKIKISAYCAKLISENDFVYIDAGTTTELMADYLQEKNAIYVTNGINHAKKIAEKGLKVFLIGGELKSSTEAIIGAQAVSSIDKFNFTKGFFGVNGLTEKSGFTTPDIKEAAVKEAAIKKCRKVYLLCDESKFGKVFPVTFANLSIGTVITTKLKDNNIKQKLDLVEVE